MNRLFGDKLPDRLLCLFHGRLVHYGRLVPCFRKKTQDDQNGYVDEDALHWDYASDEAYAKPLLEIEESNSEDVPYIAEASKELKQSKSESSSEEKEHTIIVSPTKIKESDTSEEAKNVTLIGCHSFKNSFEELNTSVIDAKDEDDSKNKQLNRSSEDQTADAKSELEIEVSNPVDVPHKAEASTELKQSKSDSSYEENEPPTIVSPTEIMESDTSSDSSQFTGSPSEEPLYVTDILEIKTDKDLPPTKTAATPDIVVKVGKNHEIPITKKFLCTYSKYFYDHLAFNNENLSYIKVKEECVNPKAFKCILRYLLFNRPLTCHNLTTEVIRTATYLQMNHVICKIELMVYNRMESVDYALAQLALIHEIQAQLENSPLINKPTKKSKVFIKGQRTNLKAKHMKKLSDLKYIRKQKERFFYGTVQKGGNIFQQLAMKPHIVVEDSNNLTLTLFNVFKNNFKDALFVDSETYRQSMEGSLRDCTEFLAQRLEKVVLGSSYLRLKKAPIEMLLQQDVIGARSEMVVYLAALKWLNFDFEERKNFSRDVLSSVRFSQMSRREIMALYQPPVFEDMMRMPHINDIIDQDQFSNPRTLLLKGRPLILKEHSASDQKSTSDMDNIEVQ